MAEAFYERDGDRFLSSPHTRGPWDPGSQHAGPPAALLARALERCEPPDGPAQIGRVTFDILRPVPIAPLVVQARVVRPGRSVELLEATLADEDGRELVRATAWRLRTGAVTLPPELQRLPPPPGPEAGKSLQFLDFGYFHAMDIRFVAGDWRQPGPATVWLRMRHALLAGEEPTPLQRVLVAADSGNGVSAELDLERFLFINTDLTVHLHRMPEGEWVCLDAVTRPEPHGIGMTDTLLFDERGPIGRAAQTLLVRERARGG